MKAFLIYLVPVKKNNFPVGFIPDFVVVFQEIESFK